MTVSVCIELFEFETKLRDVAPEVLHHAREIESSWCVSRHRVSWELPWIIIFATASCPASRIKSTEGFLIGRQTFPYIHSFVHELGSDVNLVGMWLVICRSTSMISMWRSLESGNIMSMKSTTNWKNMNHSSLEHNLDTRQNGDPIWRKQEIPSARGGLRKLQCFCSDIGLLIH